MSNNEMISSSDYRIPIVDFLTDRKNIMSTSFPSTALEAGALNVSQPVVLNKSSIIDKPEPEFYKKYYEVKIDKVKRQKHHINYHAIRNESPFEKKANTVD